jgi:hypothetical protein
MSWRTAKKKTSRPSSDEWKNLRHEAGSGKGPGPHGTSSLRFAGANPGTFFNTVTCKRRERRYYVSLLANQERIDIGKRVRDLR